MLLERNPSSAEGDLTLGPSPDAYDAPKRRLRNFVTLVYRAMRKAKIEVGRGD